MYWNFVAIDGAIKNQLLCIWYSYYNKNHWRTCYFSTSFLFIAFVYIISISTSHCEEGTIFCDPFLFYSLFRLCLQMSIGDGDILLAFPSASAIRFSPSASLHLISPFMTSYARILALICTIWYVFPTFLRSLFTHFEVLLVRKEIWETYCPSLIPFANVTNFSIRKARKF
jgi:hypothetical protein